jgi:hypothetical protein
MDVWKFSRRFGALKGALERLGGAILLKGKIKVVT